MAAFVASRLNEVRRDLYGCILMSLDLRRDKNWHASCLAACLPVLRPGLNKMLYGSVKSATTRAWFSARSIPSEIDGSDPAHLMTIGGQAARFLRGQIWLRLVEEQEVGV